MVGSSPKLLTILLLGLTCGKFVVSLKLKLASEHDCDRHSLDALYHEKYARETENALTGITEFVNKVTDLMVDSLTSIMADLPGRESSDALEDGNETRLQHCDAQEERKIFMAFSEMKKKFVRTVNKLKTNMTSSWESLMEAHYSLMLDNGKFTLSDVLNRTNYVADVYASSRSVLDSSLGTVISSFKDIIRYSMQGISTVADKEIQKEAAEKSKTSNDTSEDGKKGETSKDASETNNESRRENQEPGSEEQLKNKKKDLVKMLAPEFLGKVSVIIIDSDVDLEKKVTKKSEDRDSVLDDMYFNLVMIRSRVNAIIQEDSLKTKEMRDLARRNLYIYFAEHATKMYNDRLKQKGNAESSGTGENQQLWKDENDLAESLVDLMENYS